MSFLAGLGGPLAGALGGAISPVSGLGMAGGPMSDLGALSALFGKGGGGGEAAAPQANAAATGLGKLIGVDPGRISSIADSIGKGMNQIAQGGGAQGGYAAPQLPDAPVQNHLQLLDPAVIQALIQRFGGGAMR